MSKNINMTQGEPGKLLFSFALPLMLGNVFQQMYTVVDTAIVGQGVGMQALAALGALGSVPWLFTGIAQGITQGFSVRISQRFGERNEEGLRHTAAQSAFLCSVITIILTVLAQLILPLFLAVLRVPPELWAMAELYGRVILGGFPVVMLYNYCSGILRAVGDSKTPLVSMIIASIANILLDALTVFVFHWGIGGAAAATVVAQGLASAFCVWKIWKMPLLHFAGGQLKPEAKPCRDLLIVGIPVALKNTLIAVGALIVQSVFNRFGTSFIAGTTSADRLYGLMEIAALSYGYAVTTYMGQNYGAGKPDRIHRGMKVSVILSLVTSLVITAVMVLCGRGITKLFISSEDPLLAAEAGQIAYTYLVIMSCCMPILYLDYVYHSALLGLGDTKITIVTGVVEFILRVGVSLMMGAINCQAGLYWAGVAPWIGAAIVASVSYHTTIHKRLSQWDGET